MKFLAKLINSHYKVIIVLSVIVFGVFFVIASGLSINSNMEEMLPEESKSVIAQKEMEKAFEGTETGIILIKGDKKVAIPAIEELGNKLKSLPQVAQVFYKIDLGSIGNKAFLYGDDEYLILEGILDRLENNGSFIELDGFLDNLNNRNSQGSVKYLESDNGKAWVIQVKPRIQGDYAESRAVFYKAVKENLDIILAENPGLSGGITGGMFIADYEADTVAFEGMDKTFLITLILITVFLVFSFRRLKTPLLALYPLLGGALGAAALARIVFGSLNMFSSSFALLLLGLGIDFAIHLTARFYEEIQNNVDINKAIEKTLVGTGSSIIIGALTTSFAFLAFLLADFRAFVQMGLVSGMGVLVIGFTMIILMPALLRATGGKSLKNLKIKPLNLPSKLYLPLIIVFALGLFILIPYVMNTRVVGDIDKLYPENIPSNYWSKELKENFGVGGETLGIVVDSMDKLVVYQEKLNASPLVDSTSSILNYIPNKMDYKLGIISRLSGILIEAGVPENQINLFFPTDPVKVEDLPRELRNLFIGAKGEYLLEIIPKLNIAQVEEYKKIEKEIQVITQKVPGGLSGIMNEIVGLVKTDILRICLVCLVVILAFLWFIFKKPIHVLITISPIILAVYSTLGVLNLLNIDINVFSIAAFPLIIGIGIDGGIHLMHRLVSDTVTDYKAIISHTSKAILTTSVTTIIGFGSLGLINHPGMANLGLTVALGVGLSLIFTLTIIPFYYIFNLNRQNPSKSRAELCNSTSKGNLAKLPLQ